MTVHKLPQPLDSLHAQDQVLRTVADGDVLFLQNSPTAGLFYLISGKINLQRSSSSGHTVMIHRAVEGETFAEASVFSDTYHCTATAALESRLIECSRPAILALFKSDPNFSTQMAVRFARQIQESRRRVELLSIRAADERILEAIGDGLLDENIVSFAETIALAPETVYRNLASLTQQEKIEKTSRGRYRLILNDHC